MNLMVNISVFVCHLSAEIKDCPYFQLDISGLNQQLKWLNPVGWITANIPPLFCVCKMRSLLLRPSVIGAICMLTRATQTWTLVMAASKARAPGWGRSDGRNSHLKPLPNKIEFKKWYPNSIIYLFLKMKMLTFVIKPRFLSEIVSKT